KTMRRCVICGERPPMKDAFGNNAYAYPKNEEEARIWRTSMAAQDICLQSILKECCVCVEHIPEFVSRAKVIGKELEKKKQKEARLERASTPKTSADECIQCPDCGEPPPDREKPSVSVLLLNGSSLPTYCAECEGCGSVESRPAEKGDSKSKVPKLIKSKCSDTEIIVQESGFQDNGGKFPDIDGTEVTLLRTPTQAEDELTQLEEEYGEGNEKRDSKVRRRRNYCLPGCTDVLLLGRGPHVTDVCPCQCDECKKASGVSEAEACCKLECCPTCEPEYYTHPPCGCECEQQARRELGKIIKAQAKRIQELEDLLCRQNNMRNCLQQTLDELYCRFGQLDDAEDEAFKSGISCPGGRRGGPDCASVLSARSERSEPEKPVREDTPLPQSPKTGSYRSMFSKITMKKFTVSEAPSKISQDTAPVPERVHGFAERKPEIAKHTRRPLWVNEALSEEELITTGQTLSIKF
ncbi:hypothetical protein KR054_007287, partial [Drosophila jambulina]